MIAKLQGRNEEAENYFYKGIKLPTAKTHIVIELAQLLWEQERHNEAVRNIEKQATRFGNPPVFRKWLEEHRITN